MKKNFLILLITIFVAALCAFCVTACRGEKGNPGESGVNVEGAYIENGELYLILSSGAYVNCGKVVGTDGENGENGLDGVGIVDIQYNEEGELVIKFANGTIRNVGVSPKVCSHKYGEWIVETVVGCANQGHRYRICTECGFADHEITPPTGHSWDTREDVVLQPETCTDEGWKLSTCAKCRETKLVKIEAKQHVFNEKAYTADNRQYIKCSFCEMRKPSEGLEYTYTKGVYQLTGLGTCTDSDIVVADVIETVNGEIKPVTAIAYNAFTGREITSIYLSKYINNIERTSGGLFGNSYCEDLNDITIHSGNTVYQSKGNCIIETATLTLIAGCTKSSIPADGSVLTVGASAFSGVTKLEKITVPDCVATLGSSAFYGCIGLTEVTLGGGLTLIGESCFANCAGLTKVTINGVTTIGMQAFWQCVNLTELTLRGDCKYIAEAAFGGCKSLNNVSLPSSVLRVANYSFGGCENLKVFSYNGSGTWWNASAGLGVADRYWYETHPTLKLLGFKNTPLDIMGNYTG